MNIHEPHKSREQYPYRRMKYKITVLYSVCITTVIIIIQEKCCLVRNIIFCKRTVTRVYLKQIIIISQV